MAISLQLLEPPLKYSLSKMKPTIEQGWPPSESRQKVVRGSRSLNPGGQQQGKINSTKKCLLEKL